MLLKTFSVILKHTHLKSLSNFLLVSLFALNSTAQAALFQKADQHFFTKENLPKELLVPGGIALIPFKHKSKSTPEVTFLGNRVMVLKTAKKQWLAVVGLGLKLKAGEQHIEVKRKKDNEKINFQIEDKEYEAQYITLKNKKQVSPSKESLNRIKQESGIMKSAFRSWGEEAPKSLAMDYPVKGPLTSQFGLKRFFNKQPRNPHSGIDIAANKGSAINTPLSGIIAATGHYYFNGNTVLVDHGQGMIAMYCHLDQIQVKKGQSVSSGDTLGTVGSTGRATGPHLHWSLNLNNTRVDPLLFLNTP